MWIDNHTHINMLEISASEAIEAAKSAGVERYINIGTHPDDIEAVFETTKKFFPLIQCSLGLHPHEAKHFNPDIDKMIRKFAESKEVIAVGEIGLDFYYNHSDKDVQMNVFERQMQMAADLGLPVEIHTRDAEPETIQVLKKFPQVKGVIHCFTGTPWLATEAMKLGYNISISGIVTFPKAIDLQNTVKALPLDRIHIETDAPFLAPVPMRGRKNVPAYLAHTAKFVAQLKNVSESDLAKQLQENTKRIFPKFQL